MWRRTRLVNDTHGSAIAKIHSAFIFTWTFWVTPQRIGTIGAWLPEGFRSARAFQRCWQPLGPLCRPNVVRSPLNLKSSEGLNHFPRERTILILCTLKHRLDCGLIFAGHEDDLLGELRRIAGTSCEFRKTDFIGLLLSGLIEQQQSQMVSLLFSVNL